MLERGLKMERRVHDSVLKGKQPWGPRILRMQSNGDTGRLVDQGRDILGREGCHGSQSLAILSPCTTKANSLCYSPHPSIFPSFLPSFHIPVGVDGDSRHRVSFQPENQPLLFYPSIPSFVFFFFGREGDGGERS